MFNVYYCFSRGAFYLDKEEEVFKQDFSGATLDDHFDKTVLPKVCIYILTSHCISYVTGTQGTQC